MAVKLAIDDVNLSPSPCTNFRNVGGPVQSGCYPHTKIFIGIDSLIRRGELGIMGWFFLDMIM